MLGEWSRAYWETANRVVFPSGFTPTLDWNRDFAAKVVRSFEGNVYFTPIRVDLSAYLSDLLTG